MSDTDRTVTAYLRVIDRGTSLMVAVTKPARRLGFKAGDTIKVTIEKLEEGD